jgi:hypothetical protein
MTEFRAVMYDENQDDVFLYPEESGNHKGNSCEIIAEIDDNNYLTFENHFSGKDKIEKYLIKCDGGYRYSYLIYFLNTNNLKIKREDKSKF